MKMRTTFRRVMAIVALTTAPVATIAAADPPGKRPALLGTPVGPEKSGIVLAGKPVVEEETAVKASRADGVTRGYMSDNVIVVSIDGLRPDAIEKYNAKTLKRLMQEGSYTMHASTILPSKTLPSHTSMLTGMEPEEHGVNWNSEEMETHGHIATPTIFAKAHEAGFSTAAFFSKSKFEHLAVPGTLDHFEAPNNFLGKRHAGKTVGRAKKYMESHKPNLLFVHIGEPDFVGHIMGWMTDPYGWAVDEADEQVGKLLEAAEKTYGTGNYTVIVTADHGGHGRDHGSDDPRDVTIPWITWGKSVAAGTQLGSDIRTMDTAATALWLLGVEPGDITVGKPVASAFGGGPVHAAAH